MTYQTRVAIEIAGIRRAIPLAFEYHVQKIDGIEQPIHDSVRVLTGEPLSGEWIYKAIGARQLKELDRRLMEHWASEWGRADSRSKQGRDT